MRCCEFIGIRLYLPILIILLFVSPAIIEVDATKDSKNDGHLVEMDETDPMRDINTKYMGMAVIDIKKVDERISCSFNEKLVFNFVIEELNGVDITFNSALFDFHSLDGEEHYGSISVSALGIGVEGGSSVEANISFFTPKDIFERAFRNGDDRVNFKMEIEGVDENQFHIDHEVWSEFTVVSRVAVLCGYGMDRMTYEKLDRYISDVQKHNDVVFHVIDSNWPSPELVRQELISLWENHSISGAILVGDIPFAMWELNHSDGSKEPCPIPIFFEDLDGRFVDNDSNGFYDLHYWGENDGPEIWVSFLSPPSEVISTSNLRTGGPGSSPGLTGTYYRDNNFQIPVMTRTDSSVEYYWLMEDPPNPVPPDSFSIEWTGQIMSEYDETVTFEVLYGGGVIFEIDGVEHLNDDTNPPWSKKTEYLDLNMTSGWHDIKLQYRENGWGDYKGMIRLSWRTRSGIARSLNDWFDKDHMYYTGELNAPRRGFLFMDYAYGAECNMLDPVREDHLEPLFGDHLTVGGGQNTTNKTEYFENLDLGHELTSIWSHASGKYHQFGVPPGAPAKTTNANTYEIKQTNGSLVTLIWGCHAGDFAGSDYWLSASKTENLVVNYAFNTKFGLASMGCTRSYGTTFNRVYHDLKEGSFLGMGYFHYKEEGYDKERRMAETHPLGEKMWIEDEVMFGDPFIRIYNFPDSPRVEIENGSRFTSGGSVEISIISQGATQMRITCEGDTGSWIPFNSSRKIDIDTVDGPIDVLVETRNGYGSAKRAGRDRIIVDDISPRIDRFMINDGGRETNNRTVLLSIGATDNKAGLDSMCFSHNGNNWTRWENVSTEKLWILEEGDSTKYVHVMIRDTVGNYATMRQSIDLDMTGPGVWADVIGAPGNDGWYLSQVTVKLYSIEKDLDLIEYMLGGSDWRTYTDPLTIHQDGIHSLSFRAYDGLGNGGAENNITLKMDTTEPENITMNFVREMVYTNEQIVLLMLDAYDGTSGLYQMSFSIDEFEWTPWVNFSTMYWLDIGDGEWIKSIHFRVRDQAGKIGVLKDPLTVILDTMAPALVSSSPRNNENVGKGTNVTFQFNENLDEYSINITITDDTGRSIDFEHHLGPEGLIEIEPELEGYGAYVVTISGDLSDIAGNRMGYNTTLEFTVFGQPPGNPTDPRADLNDTEVELTWNAPRSIGDLSIVHYIIYRSGGGEGWTEIDTTMDTFYVDRNVIRGESYSYRIAAYNGLETGDPSYEVTVTIPGIIIDSDDDDDTGQGEAVKRSPISPALIVLSISMILLLLTGIITIFLFYKKKDDMEE